MALDLLQQILFTFGPAELPACLVVAVPLYVIVTRGLDAAEHAWTPLPGLVGGRRNENVALP